MSINCNVLGLTLSLMYYKITFIYYTHKVPAFQMVSPKTTTCSTSTTLTTTTTVAPPCTVADICVPCGPYSECLKHILYYPCAKIYDPVCTFNGFEYKVYGNNCVMAQDQQCRKDGLSLVNYVLINQSIILNFIYSICASS